MKNLYKFIFIIILIIVVILIRKYILIENNKDTIANNEIGNNAVENQEVIKEESDVVKITNEKIKNEDLIDKFIEDTNSTKEIITLQIEQDDKLIQVDFVPDEISQTQADLFGTEEEPININSPETELDFQLFSGYYIITENKQEKGRYSKMKWELKRKVEENNVILYIDTMFYDLAEMVKICEYDINSSNYKKADYNLSYYQRKDMGSKKIIDKNESAIYDFDIYTVGGDVNITIDGDMVYDFKKSLEENIITIDEILNQAKEDTKYGICEEGYYQDGGTTEYMYEEYTLIKYNTLDGNADFVVAPKGDVRNQVDKILYK